MSETFVHPPRGPSPITELPVDEYARRNKLSIDFQSYNPVSYLTSTANSLLGSQGQGGGEDESLPDLHIPFNLSLSEPPVISKGSVSFLSSIAQREDDEAIMSGAIQAACSKQIRHLKVSLPLLRSDHESDWRKLLRDVRERTNVHLYSNMFPSEPLEISLDEAPEYPESVYSFRSQLARDADTSQLAMSQDALRFLATTLAIDKDAEDPTQLLEGAFHVSQCHSAINSAIPVASDPCSLLEEDLEAAQSALIAASSPPILGTPVLPSSSGVEAFSPVIRKTESLKVEQPLIPSRPNSPSVKHTIDLQEAALGAQLAIDADYEVDGYAWKEIPDLLSDELLEELQAGAHSANLTIEQERLEHADAVARVQVPIMDFAIIDPEWRKLGQDSSRHIKYLLQAPGMALKKSKGNYKERDF
ncbi:hypothetical protein PG984_008868 [Apiospora sp. TS-2023a]